MSSLWQTLRPELPYRGQSQPCWCRGTIATHSSSITPAFRAGLHLVIPPLTVVESINFCQDSNQIKALREKTRSSTRWLVDFQTASTNSNTSAEQWENSFSHLLYCLLCWGEEKDWLLKTLAASLCFFNVTRCDAKLAECEIASREKTQSPPSRVKFPLSIHFTVSSPKTAGGVILPHNCRMNSIFWWWRQQSSFVLSYATYLIDVFKVVLALVIKIDLPFLRAACKLHKCSCSVFAFLSVN